MVVTNEEVIQGPRRKRKKNRTPINIIEENRTPIKVENRKRKTGRKTGRKTEGKQDTHKYH